MTFSREIRLRPAYDRRDPDPAKNYGVHGVQLCFTLRHPSGEGLTFSVSTNWHLPSVDTTAWQRWQLKPLAFSVDLHTKKPQYEGHLRCENCHVTGSFCYTDGSARLGDEFLSILIAGGDEALWKRMEEQYAIWGGAQ